MQGTRETEIQGEHGRRYTVRQRNGIRIVEVWVHRQGKRDVLLGQYYLETPAQELAAANLRWVDKNIQPTEEELELFSQEFSRVFILAGGLETFLELPFNEKELSEFPTA